MITDFFETLWENILALLVSILPASQGLPSEIDSAVVFVANLSGTLGYIFPIGTLFSVIILGVSFEIGLLFFKIVMAVIGFVRGS